ncbi:hypothetical protein HBI08_162900 [Parastagonospora nodorum]|nr:hypothetical protein HBI08_162900 [Parastagonospora nodorum]
MNVREEYRIITLEVIKLIEDLISYLIVAKYIQLRNAQISKVFYKASSSVVSNRSIALITNKFSVALLTKLAILNNANIALVDAVHYSVIDALMITLIKNNDDLLGTVNFYIKPPLKRCKTKAADSRYAKVSRGRTKKDKDLENSNTSSDVLRLRRRDRRRKKLRSLTDAYILYFKELLSNNSGIFANAIGIGKTQAIVLAVLIGYFCFFSNSPLENIGRLTKEKAIEMQINTTNAISKALAAANKLFIIVCSFRKVDKHVFRAYNTISVTAQRTIIRKGGLYIEKRAILLPSYVTFNATNKRDSVTSNRIYKIEDARNIIANIKHDASKYESSYNCLYLDFLSIVQNAKQQCRDILEKEGLNKLEASRRIIFNCFKMQAIFKIYSSYKVKRFTLNSIKDLFTNLSKNYFLVQEALALIAFAEVITLIEATHVVIIELQDSIIYFNLDSELELKVLGKQDVKTTS